MPAKGTSKYPTHVKPHFAKIAKWIRDGVPEFRIAKALGIGKTTWERFKHGHLELVELINKSQQNSDAAIEGALYRRASGFEYEERTEEFDSAGNLLRVKITRKHCAPHVGAAIFWLKNRNPEEWRDIRGVALERSSDFNVVLPEVPEGIRREMEEATGRSFADPAAPKVIPAKANGSSRHL